MSSLLIDQVTGTSTDTNIVNIQSGSTANDFIIRRISSGGAANSIVDTPRTTTLTNLVVTLYSVDASAIGSEDIYSTSPNLAKNLLNSVALGKLIVCPGCSPAGATVNSILYMNTGSITPTAVRANSCSDQTFTVTGLVQASDEIGQVKWPEAALGNLSRNGTVSANNKVLVHFCNPSAGSVTAPRGAYAFFVFR